MENTNQYPKNGNSGEENDPLINAGKDGAEFENPSVDPGFETSNDDTEDVPDSNNGTDDNEDSNDALNYDNDRENGAYNPKNI